MELVGDNKHNEPVSRFNLGFRTIIEFKGYKGKTIRRIKNGLYYFNRDLPDRVKNLKYALHYLEAVKGQVGISNQQSLMAWHLYNKIKELRVNLGRTIETVMDSCIKINSPRTYNEIIKVTSTDRTALFRTVKELTLNDKLKQFIH